jgi:hypothetical protein
VPEKANRKQLLLEWARRQQKYGQTTEHATRIRAGKKLQVLGQKMTEAERTYKSRLRSLERMYDPRAQREYKESLKKTRASRFQDYLKQHAAGKGKAGWKAAYAQFNMEERIRNALGNYTGDPLSGRDINLLYKQVAIPQARKVKEGLKGFGATPRSGFLTKKALTEAIRLGKLPGQTRAAYAAAGTRLDELAQAIGKQTGLAARRGKEEEAFAGLEKEFERRGVQLGKGIERSRRLEEQHYKEAGYGTLEESYGRFGGTDFMTKLRDPYYRRQRGRALRQKKMRGLLGPSGGQLGGGGYIAPTGGRAQLGPRGGIGGGARRIAATGGIGRLGITRGRGASARIRQVGTMARLGRANVAFTGGY